jgi:type II secretory pathway pseudopilin PulG
VATVAPVHPVVPQLQQQAQQQQQLQRLQQQLQQQQLLEQRAQLQQQREFHHQQQLNKIQDSIKTYQPVDLSGPRYYQPAPQKKPEDFHTVVSRPFIDYKRNTTTPPAFPESFPSDTQKSRHYWDPTPNIPKEESPQSRTFRMLQSVMENEEPYAGAEGLPGPRSASKEQLRHNMEASRGSPRVKVLMAQKYNTPLGMYSAENVIESFAVHTETALESIERQRPALPEQAAVFASNR